MVKIAIIGAGFIGNVHLEAFSNISAAKVVAVADSNEEKGRETAAKAGADYYGDIDELLKKSDADVIDICTPTFMHADMVGQAAKSGRHIFCEKPLALDLKEADAMVDAVKKNNIKGMVGHVLRFWPQYVEAKKIIDSGKLGKPYHAFCERLCVTPAWPWKGWMTNEKLSKGAPVDMQIHDLDYLIWLFGPPKNVKAQGVFSKDLNSYMHIGTTVEFKSGQHGLTEAGYGFKGEFPFTMVLRILCENGTVEWIYRAGKTVGDRGEEFEPVVYLADGTVYKPEYDHNDPYYLECKYFVDCIENDTEITQATFEQGWASLQLALASFESAKKGTVVKIR
jgi:predicted dehydrogenase